MINDVQLRPATNADAPAVCALVADVHREYGLASCHADGFDADLADLESSYFHVGGGFDVLTAPEGQLIGCVGLLPVRDGVCELRKMYLRQPWRGRGLGRQLLEHALAQARRLGYRRIELETASVLVEAIGLYERYGFVPIHSDAPASRCNLAYALDLA